MKVIREKIMLGTKIHEFWVPINGSKWPKISYKWLFPQNNTLKYIVVSPKTHPT